MQSKPNINSEPFLIRSISYFICPNTYGKKFSIKLRKTKYGCKIEYNYPTIIPLSVFPENCLMRPVYHESPRRISIKLRNKPDFSRNKIEIIALIWKSYATLYTLSGL